MFSVGMPTFDDFDGVYFTTQALKLYHAPHVTELLVVDNNPGGTVAPHLRAYCEQAGVRYVPFGDVQGTAAAKNAVFDAATGSHVVCLDSHVLLAPGALQALSDFYAREPEFNGLLQGPLVYDNLIGTSTHLDRVWRGQMLGTWGLAWQCPCGVSRFAVVEAGGKAFAVRLVEQDEYRGCPMCGHSADGLPWPLHEDRLAAAGCRELHTVAADFAIPAMGMGAFACKRQDWLRYHAEFRGFGGEEYYIHDKYRKLGREVRCVSGFKWSHRFGRPNGVAYQLTDADKKRNFLIGHNELGLDTAPVEAAFPGCRSCRGPAATYKTLDEWYAALAQTASDINEHCPTLRELAAQCGTAVDMGMRAESTLALAAGVRGKLYVFSRQGAEQLVASINALSPGKAELTNVVSKGCDLLFVDTVHTAAAFSTELADWHHSVSRYIARHDTVTYGERGEDGSPGLMHAVRGFVRENREWTVLRADRNNNGLVVLGRDERDKKPRPPVIAQASTFASALFKHITAGLPQADPQRVELRLIECDVCPSRNGQHCGECGCPVEKKAGWEGEQCPLGKW